MTPLYLVSSFPRSGSSMMMRCLEAGGLPAKYDKSQEYLNLMYGDDGYAPNGNGFYNFMFGEKDIPTLYENYKGMVMKCPWQYLQYLPVGQYKLVFIKRDPKEIEASMHRFSNEVWYEEDALLVYDQLVSALFEKLNARSDFQMTVLNYADIVALPAVEFSKLVLADWPINVTNAAAMVDPSLHRFKLENL